MARKTARPTFDQIIQMLKSHLFEVAPYNGVAGAVQVSKNGTAAVLAPANSGEFGPAAAFVEHPGILVKGEIARLLDRGYQKFIKSSQYELPATAAQLHAIHAFSEELIRLVGGTSLYNESLGTTSDVYEYDRLRGREAEQRSPKRPWELTGGH